MLKSTRREWIQAAGAAALAGPLLGQQKAGGNALALWYREPAKQWTEALPVGNGNLGAMVFGGVPQERIQLNEHTLWSGHHVEDDNAEARAQISRIRQLLFEGKYAEANSVARPGGRFVGPAADRDTYQTLGDLLLELRHDGAPEGYRRELNIDTGIARVEYQVGGARFTREVFASQPDQAIFVRLECDRPGGLSFTARLTRETGAQIESVGNAHLVMRGQAPNEGVHFECHLEVRSEGGATAASSGGVNVEKARAATLVLYAATSYNGKDPSAECQQRRTALSERKYEDARPEHIADHHRLFRRVALELGGPDRSDVPTGERLAAMKAGGTDPQLIALYFQYGRYLLLSSSRPGTMPANLQGIWAEGLHPPWEADYHVNINIQMNYWPAEVCTLSECAGPLFDFTEKLIPPGRKTAQLSYGCSGFVVHFTTNAWFQTSLGAPQGISLWQGASGWLARHFWEHYRFTGDLEFLRNRAWPVMKAAAEFYLDYMVTDPVSGQLMTGPASSPENSYKTPDGGRASVDINPTMSVEIIRDLLTNLVRAGDILRIEPEFCDKANFALNRMTPLKVGQYGQIQEWSQDFEEVEPGHRHMSQLYALHPANQITLRRTPELAAAAKATIQRRLANGGGHTGWSRAWIINFWARLEEGDTAYEHLLALLRNSTLSNLFDTHPPFQIDGNFGGTAGIAEMLLQSHVGEIHLLPALPKAWAEGRVRGLRARGGVEVEIVWSGGRPVEASIEATQDGDHRIRVPAGTRVVKIRASGRNVTPSMDPDGVLKLLVRRGVGYRISFA